jgi:hypothetical protein
VAKPFGSHGGGLTCHGGRPGMLKTSDGKSMDVESPGGVGTGGEDQGSEPLE